MLELHTPMRPETREFFFQRDDSDTAFDSPAASVSSITVETFGYPMVCQYEWDCGEPAILWGDGAHPGREPGAALIACLVGGIDIINELRDTVVELIEADIKKKVQS